MDIKNIDVYLRERGVKPSYQRKRIFEYLMSHHNHPTVNDIYDALIDEIPTLSKATVYNTMNLFIEHKLIEVVPIESNEARYDIYNPKEHGHFKCELCGEIYDVNIKIPIQQISDDLDGFSVSREVYNFRGVCKRCIALKESKVI